MILHQFYLGCLAHASYLIGDERTRTAWVIDPQRDIEGYLAFAAERGLTITDVALTHLHADFVAGHLALRDRVGARVHLGSLAQVGFAFVPASDGAEYVFGAVRLVAWHTPGHTPEGVTWLVYDLDRDAQVPQAALTGDTLFIGDVGRPDLLASVGVDAQHLAGQLYESLARLLTLPDAVAVYPAHGAGSLCGRNLSRDTVSTMGRERSGNYALQPMPRADFIARVAAEQPPAPAYFAHDVALNRSEHATTASPVSRLPLGEFRAAVAAGAQVLDVRAGTAFAAAHLPGAINVGIDGQFALWAGALLDPHQALAIVCEPGREDEVVLRLRRIGIERIAGILAGGMAACEGVALASLPRWEAAALRTALAGPQPPLVIDVRNPSERAVGTLPGALAIALPELPRRLQELPREREIVVHCAGGYRSLAGASLLMARGWRAGDLLGGYQAWAKLSG